MKHNKIDRLYLRYSTQALARKYIQGGFQICYLHCKYMIKLLNFSTQFLHTNKFKL